METQELEAHDTRRDALGSQTVGGVHANMSVCGYRERRGGRPHCLAGSGKQAGFSLDGESVMQHVRGC